MAEVLVPIVAMLLTLGPIGYWIKRRFDLKELQARNTAPKQLAAAAAGHAEFEDRVRNLEAIVTNVDYELNVRIAKLAAAQNRMSQALPALERAPTVAADAAAAQVPGGNPGELVVGSTLAERYKIDRPLGRGGMGSVYLAQDSVLGETIALKVVSSAYSANAVEAADRFRREATAARKVSSPNVIRIHDLGQTPDGLLYISMEYFPGKTLADLIAARGTLGLDENRDIVGQVCEGLDAAHQAGVIHRDLKPANVLVGERQSVKLIDFGLATATFFHSMTATGLSFGTPEYMSPEQVRGRPTDARADIYSLGALLYHTLSGRPPFSGDTPIAIGFAHCSQEPRPPRELRPELPEALENAVLGALAKDPSDRPDLAEIKSVL